MYSATPAPIRRDEIFSPEMMRRDAEKLMEMVVGGSLVACMTAAMIGGIYFIAM